jgi:hypothetical protein
MKTTTRLLGIIAIMWFTFTACSNGTGPGDPGTDPDDPGTNPNNGGSEQKVVQELSDPRFYGEFTYTSVLTDSPLWGWIFDGTSKAIDKYYSLTGGTSELTYEIKLESGHLWRRSWSSSSMTWSDAGAYSFDDSGNLTIGNRAYFLPELQNVTVKIIGDRAPELQNVSVSAPLVYIGMELTTNYTGSETVSFQWNKDNIPINGATNATYSPDSAGRYTATVSARGYISKTSNVISAFDGYGSVTITNSTGISLMYFFPKMEGIRIYNFTGDIASGSSRTISVPVGIYNGMDAMTYDGRTTVHGGGFTVTKDQTASVRLYR